MITAAGGNKDRAIEMLRVRASMHGDLGTGASLLNLR